VVSLSIYDVSGRLVKILVKQEQNPGTYTVMWDGQDNAGAYVGNGIYFYRLDVDGYQATRNFVMLTEEYKDITRLGTMSNR
jgi:flagellar hook assembly protein FlgD